MATAKWLTHQHSSTARWASKHGWTQLQHTFKKEKIIRIFGSRRRRVACSQKRHSLPLAIPGCVASRPSLCQRSLCSGGQLSEAVKRTCRKTFEAKTKKTYIGIESNFLPSRRPRILLFLAVSCKLPQNDFAKTTFGTAKQSFSLFHDIFRAKTYDTTIWNKRRKFYAPVKVTPFGQWRTSTDSIFDRLRFDDHTQKAWCFWWTGSFFKGAHAAEANYAKQWRQGHGVIVRKRALRSNVSHKLPI